jgi:hypothetical protein
MDKDDWNVALTSHCHYVPRLLPPCFHGGMLIHSINFSKKSYATEVTKNSVGDGLVILIPKKRRFWNAVLVASF